MDWLVQVVMSALIAVSLLCLGAYLVHGSRRWLVATLAMATVFVAVPAATATSSVFNDSGSVQ